MEEETLLRVAGTVHDGDAEEVIGAVAIRDAEDGGLAGFRRTCEGLIEELVPSHGGLEVVVDLDEDLAAGGSGGEVPCADAGAFGICLDHMAIPGEGDALLVIEVDGEEVLDALGMGGAVEPEAAGFGGELWPAAGGMQKADDGAAGGLHGIDLTHIRLGEAAIGAKGHGVEMGAEPAVVFAAGVPDVIAGRADALHGFGVGKGIAVFAGAQLEVDHLPEGLAAVGHGVECLDEVLLLCMGIGGDLRDVDEELVTFIWAALGMLECLMGDREAFFDVPAGAEGLPEVEELGEAALGLGDAAKDAEISLVVFTAAGAGGMAPAGAGLDDDAGLMLRVFEGDVFVDGEDPVEEIALHDALADDAELVLGDVVGEGDDVRALFGDAGTEGGPFFRGGIEHVIGIRPGDIVAGGELPCEIPCGGEVIDVRPIGMVKVVVILGAFAAAAAGDLEGGIGCLIADGADDDDLIEVRREGVEEAGHVVLHVSGDDGEADFHRRSVLSLLRLASCLRHHHAHSRRNP